MRVLSTFILILLGTLWTVAQTVQDIENASDAQIEQFIKELESRGLTEAQIEQAALANGYTPEAIILMRERANKIKVSTSSKDNVLTNASREQLGELSERADIQVAQKENGALQVYGKEIFNNKKLNFQPNLRIPTPSDYIIGPDDELKIDITGYAYQHYDLKVSPEGTVKLESLSPINVNGLSIEQAQVKIKERLKTLFGGLRNGSLNMDLTLGNVRSISVTVMGEVANPGTYTISSLAKAFNALYLSGGPTDLGSFRNIKIIRANKEIGKIDLYSLLKNGILEGNISLKDEDILFVPIADKKIALSGEVKRPAIYELQANESLSQLLNYAGDYTSQAYKAFLQVSRNTSTEKKLLTVSQEQTMDFQLQNGDQVFIGSILDKYENRVEVSGAVYRPGSFSLDEQLKTVKDLIQKAEGLREDAFTNRAILVRQRENLDPEFISIDLKELLAGVTPDISLKKEDQLIVKSVVELREKRMVDISGSINQPGEYDFVEDMSLADLVLISGGFQEGATPKHIEIARRLYNDETNSESVELFNVEISKNLTKTNTFILMPFDKVFVRNLPNYEAQKMVRISGEVNYPGQYAIAHREERISDLVERAGGLRVESYLRGARFYRDSQLVALDLIKALEKNNSIGNLILQDGDSLMIPKLQGTVSIKGAVLNPTEIAFDPSYSIRDYIAQAGGTIDTAYVKHAYVRYANGLTDRTRSFLGIKNFPKPERGMELIIPTRKKVRWVPAERIAVSSALVSIATIIATIVRLYN